MKVTAKTYIEVEIGVTGTFQRGYAAAGPTYSSGGEPGEADGFEDVTVEDIGLVIHTYDQRPGTPRWVTRSLLDGIDRKSPMFAQLMANVLKFCGDDAEQALLGELGE